MQLFFLGISALRVELPLPSFQALSSWLHAPRGPFGAWPDEHGTPLLLGRLRALVLWLVGVLGQQQAVAEGQQLLVEGLAGPQGQPSS